MALPKLSLIRFTEMSENSFDTIRETDSAAREEELRTMPQSACVRVQPNYFYPERIRTITMDVVAAVYEDAYGYRFDFDRVVESFGYTRLDFPRRLMGPLLIDLSKHLHPGRKQEFLRTACETLHQLESTPRVFV